jgi:Flp pilus assembly protein TadG
MTFTHFLANRQGNFAILSAIILPVLMFGTGAAVDYGLAVQTQQRLQAAAEAAVLGAVSEAQLATAAKEDVDIEELIKESAEALFQSSVGDISFSNVKKITVVPKINKNEISAELDYKADYNTSLIGFVGYKTLPITNTARAVIKARSYVNINLLIDVSASMGIGATSDDQQKVASAINCAFACHINEARGRSKYDKARAAGADMRIDVVRDAAISAVELSDTNSEFDDQVTFGIYKFSNELTEVLSGSSNQASNINHVKAKLRNGIQMDMTNGGTNIENAIKSLSGNLPQSGSGLNENDRIQYVIVLTDGVESGQAWTRSRGWFKHGSTRENYPSKAYARHEVNYALNSTACKSLQDKEISTYVIYTEYLEPVFGHFGDHDKERFGFVTSELFPIIPDRFADCTGDPDKVVRASTPEEIERTMGEIVSGLSSPLRLF